MNPAGIISLVLGMTMGSALGIRNTTAPRQFAPPIRRSAYPDTERTYRKATGRRRKNPMRGLVSATVYTQPRHIA